MSDVALKEVGVRARRWSVTAAMVTVVLSLVACSGDEPKEPKRPLDTTPAPESVVISDEAAGFAVSIPTSWVKMPTELGAYDAAADAVRNQAPPAEAAMVAIALDQLKSAVRGGVAMAAIDPQTASTANLVTLGDQGQSPDEIAIGAANQLIPTGATDITREPLTVDGVPAVRQRFKTTVSGDNGAVTLTKSQIYAVRRGEVFILTLVGESPGLDNIGTSLKLA